MKQKGIDKLFLLIYTDLMTGAYNRTAYEEYLSRQRRKPDMRGMTVITVRVNGVHQINESYGRHTGDEAIKEIAKALIETIGEKADIYRISGTEFVCIASGSIGGYISGFKDAIGFRNAALPYELSVSLGCAAYEDGRSIDELIKESNMDLIRNFRHMR